MIIDQLLNGLSWIGIFAFAVSGALFAAEKRMDILGYMLIAAVTAIGGGSLRDLLLGVSPVFWVREPYPMTLAMVAAVLTYFLLPLIQQRDRWILWMDAVGLSVFAVLGAEAALQQQTSAVIAVVMGVMSATFGGVLRDVLCAEMLTLMRPELYISCAVTSATVYVLLSALGVSFALAALLAFAAGFVLRALAIVYGLTLPGHRA
ncbi:trimeric intracellular cation channel family protein [Oceanicoccus sagamiensis]|uniref:Glycine transporter domain-containing protein n=1 Tax=Oceanicoccus sagamiensis TaxID=716816 RepID=A0A1X9N9K8_9GAMM|nr:trimeric intracellular cation channel family protein [Oceanicoccus sagamiensis]ARN73764.1 hypothetical protein BST96_06330 [Oceanicoccus sagamiensis]